MSVLLPPRAPGECVRARVYSGLPVRRPSPNCLCWVLLLAAARRGGCQLFSLPPGQLLRMSFPHIHLSPCLPLSHLLSLPPPHSAFPLLCLSPSLPGAYRKGLATYSKEGVKMRIRNGLGPRVGRCFLRRVLTMETKAWGTPELRSRGRLQFLETCSFLCWLSSFHPL